VNVGKMSSVKLVPHNLAYVLSLPVEIRTLPRRYAMQPYPLPYWLATVEG
jgi:hypothetical protein